jgi:hypothetical protein
VVGSASVPRALRTLTAIAVSLCLAGCLGTSVRTPTPEGRPVAGTHPHILAAPFRVDAHVCEQGLSRVVTFVPVWGVAVGILTLGIVVPKTTIYHCVQGG